MNNTKKAGMVVLAGNSHQALAKSICERLDVQQAQCSVFLSSSSETQVAIEESVRAKDVYIIQTGTKNVNNDIMELMIMGYTCKTSCARNIVGVIPYLPYCKQNKMRKRGSVVCRLLADMIHKAGFTHIITMDLLQKQIQGFFSTPVENLRASSFLMHYITESISDYRNAVIVARNPDAVNRASSFAERLHIGFAVIHGVDKVADSDRDDGRTSPPPSAPTLNRMTSVEIQYIPALQAKEKPPMHVVGDVGGKIAIIVDNLIDEVGSFVSAAELLREKGAYKVYVIVTHGLLSMDAPQLLEDSCIDEVVVTNTIPHDSQKLVCSKIKTVDVSVIFSEAIRRIHNQESMSYLFRNVTSGD